MPDDTTYLTIADITKRLQVSEKTVRRWITSKQLPAIVIGTRYRIQRK